jgi:hypothetical protein
MKKELNNTHRAYKEEVRSITTFCDTKTSQFLRATSHTRLRAREHYTSTTLIGGKGGAGPSSLHTMLEGPTEYLNARWIHGYSLHGFLHGIDWIMFHIHLEYFQKPPLGGRPNTKPGDHDTPNAHNR